MEETYKPKELVKAAIGEVGTLSADEVQAAMHQGAVLIDVREPQELENGRIAGAKHIPRGVLEFKVGDSGIGKDERIVTYCAAGSRAAMAAATLKKLGYAGAIASEAGFDDLAKNGLPTEGGDG